MVIPLFIFQRGIIMIIDMEQMKDKMELLNKWREFINYTDLSKQGVMNIIQNGEYPVKVKNRIIWTSDDEKVTNKSIIFGHYLDHEIEKVLLKIYRKNGVDDKHTKFFAETKGNPNGPYRHVFQYSYDKTPEMEVVFEEETPIYMSDLKNLSLVYTKYDDVGIYNNQKFQYIFPYILDGINILKE